IVDRLEADGLVRRVPHESDRRATLAEITDRGREVAEAATLDMNASGFAFEALSADEQEQLSLLLEAVRRAEGDFSG
ncbi:MAG: MarR family transcriptional regulator, partial [Patulibacter sp.]